MYLLDKSSRSEHAAEMASAVKGTMLSRPTGHGIDVLV